MPEEEIKKRGGAKRWRTKKVDGYIHIAVVPKAGPRGGHTVAGPVHHKKKSEVQYSRRKSGGGYSTVRRKS